MIKHSMLWLLCFVCSVATMSYSDVLPRASYAKAHEHCKNQSMALPDSTVRTDHYILDVEQKEEEEVEIWIREQKVSFDGWKTLSGGTIVGFVEHHESRRKGKDCAVLRTRDTMVDEVYCYKETMGYMCTYPADKACPKQYQCLTIDNSRILYSTQMVTWFEAQQACLQLNLTLFEPPSVDIQQFAKKLSHLVADHGHYAIGMAHSIWVRDRGDGFNQTKIPATTVIKWSQNEPNPTASCAIMSTHTSLAKAVLCSNKAAYICTSQKKDGLTVINRSTKAPVEGATGQIAANASQTEMTIKVEAMAGIVLSLDIVLLVICIPAIIVFAMCLWQLHKKVKTLEQQNQATADTTALEEIDTQSEGCKQKLEQMPLLKENILGENAESTIDMKKGVPLPTKQDDGGQMIRDGLEALRWKEPKLPDESGVKE